MKIGIFSAAAPVSKDNLTKALSHLETLGHTYLLPLNPSTEHGSGKYLFSSANVADRIDALCTLLADPTVEAILCVRGAYGSGELLTQLPWDLLDSNPKPIIGMSDITNVLWAIYTKTRCPVIHGPVLVSGFLELDAPAPVHSRKWLFELLAGKGQSCSDLLLTPIHGSNVGLSGKVVAGNLTVLSCLAGTRFSPSFAEHLVILEDTGEPLYKIHRMLTQLRDAGCFLGCLGIILGTFSKCENAKQQIEPTLQNVFRDVFRGSHELPIWEGFPLGHEPLNCSVRFGQRLNIEHSGKVTFVD